MDDRELHSFIGRYLSNFVKSPYCELFIRETETNKVILAIQDDLSVRVFKHRNIAEREILAIFEAAKSPKRKIKVPDEFEATYVVTYDENVGGDKDYHFVTCRNIEQLVQFTEPQNFILDIWNAD